MYYGVKSNSDSVRTPENILNWVTETFGPYFDPTPYNPSYDPAKDTDGLVIPWQDVTYCNPPFSISYQFLKKCYKESKPGRVIVFLCKTDVLGIKTFTGGCDIVLFNKKVCFPGYSNKPPRFNCCLLVFHEHSDNKYYFFESLTGNEFVRN